MNDRLVIERVEKTRVYDLGAQTVLGLEFVRRFQRSIQRGADRDDGDIAARTMQVRFSLFYFVILDRYATGKQNFRLAIEALAFEENNRIRAGVAPG